jgi:hypothetical protein
VLGALLPVVAAFTKRTGKFGAHSLEPRITQKAAHLK